MPDDRASKGKSGIWGASSPGFSRSLVIGHQSSAWAMSRMKRPCVLSYPAHVSCSRAWSARRCSQTRRVDRSCSPLTGFGRFDLAYFRHTDRWFTVYCGLTATDCFREIEGNEIFWPTT